VRLGQDTIWWKTPHSKPIRLHQDSSFMDFLDPPQTITCWIALDDTRRDAGTLEYVPGSQHWPLTPIPADFHAPDDYRAGMRYAAEAAGISAPDPVFIEVPAGSVTFHVGEIWHGSGPNTSDNTMRRSLGIHLLRQNTRFSDKPGGYIYRRYQLTGDPAMNESFFPVLWGEGGYRTPWLDNYCRTGMR
jgi:ectoine hydroxylase-related dioxygenase (phytanoyl-CoA dioxygenase family)